MSKPVQRKRSISVSRAKRQIATRSARPRHVRFALHPVSIMVQLCVGVLLIASTISAFGDNYTVTATVPAVNLTDPAIITSPTDGQHFTDPNQTVSGTCPAASYVTVTDNAALMGTSACNSGTFQVSLLLSTGSNQLSAQDYNLTNSPGPSSNGITVYYAPPTNNGGGSSSDQGSGQTTPVSLEVVNVDQGVPYISPSTVDNTTDQPTLQGVAPAFAHITIEIHSDPIYCYTQADAYGYWACKLHASLPAGIHSAIVTAVTLSGQKLSVPLFHFRVVSTAAVSMPPSTPTTPEIQPYQSYTYKAYNVNQMAPLRLIISNGTIPYAITVNWGDGDIVTYTQTDSGLFNISHQYNWINARSKSYAVKIEVIDSNGKVADYQTLVLIRNPLYSGVVSTTAHSAHLRRVLHAIHSYLWIIWPGYAIIVLMAISFFLGARKQYDDDRRRRMRRSTHAHRRTKKNA